MIKKMSHQEFIEMLDTKGIKVVKITKNNIHIELQPAARIGLPNKRTDLYNGDAIHADWVITKPDNRKLFLSNSINNNNKIEAIMIIRDKTGLGLKDSKDIVCDNWDEWRQICLSK